VSEHERACVVHSKPAEARHGLLCVAHFDRLADMLREVEEEAAILSAVPSMAIRTGSGGGSLASERAPARLDVLAFRDPQTRRWTRDATARHPLPSPKAFGPWCLFCEHETCTDWRAGRRRDLHDDEHDAGSERVMSILGVLNGWARVVREERNLTDPDRITVSTERGTLHHHLEWLSEQPFIDEMFNEVRELVSSLKDLNGTQDEKPVGKCYLPSEKGVCDGPIWVDKALGTAHCGRCRASWTGYQITVLNYELEKIKAEKARPKTDDGRRMLTAQELAQQWRTSVDNVRKMASRQGIRAVLGHYDPDRFRDKASA
jgi:hypothetical protein